MYIRARENSVRVISLCTEWQHWQKKLITLFEKLKLVSLVSRVCEEEARRKEGTKRGRWLWFYHISKKYVLIYIVCVCVGGWEGGAETVHRVDVFPKRNDKPRIHVQETQFLWTRYSCPLLFYSVQSHDLSQRSFTHYFADTGETTFTKLAERNKKGNTLLSFRNFPKCAHPW